MMYGEIAITPSKNVTLRIMSMILFFCRKSYYDIGLIGIESEPGVHSTDMSETAAIFSSTLLWLIQ